MPWGGLGDGDLRPGLGWTQAVEQTADREERLMTHPLDAEDLMRAAEDATGLADWGGELFREPLEVLSHDLIVHADLNARGIERARRRTFKPPGMMPSWLKPRSMQLLMAPQMRSSPAFSSSGDIVASSFARFICAIVKPERADMSSISWAEENGNGTLTPVALFFEARMASSSVSVTTKPPPIE